MIVCPAGDGKRYLPLGATDGPLKKSFNSLKLLSRSVDSATALFVRADEALEIVERLMAGYGNTRISRSALDSRSTSCRRAITGARRYSHC
jgi:hypothetical protein